MSEEQIWVHHVDLDRWSEVPEDSLPAWEDLGWEHHPEGPPSTGDVERYSVDELIKRAEELGLPAPTEPSPVVEVVPDEVVPEVSILTPETPASTEDASLKQDSGTP